MDQASVRELSAEDLRTLRRRARQSLYVFARGILGFDYMVPQVHGRVCDFLTYSGKRKLLVMPRGFLKTTLASVAFPLWCALPIDEGEPNPTPWLVNAGPNLRVLIAMKTLSNAQATVDQIRGIVETNDLLRTLWPEIIPDPRKQKWSSLGAELNRPGVFREATFEAAGIGTTVTSRHYDMIIEDDLVAPDKDNLTGLEALPTKEEIEKAIGWHRLARSLLINLGDGVIFNVGTRWAKYDLIQYILDNEPNTESFRLSVYDEDGEPIYPERFPAHVLDQIKEEQGTYIFSSQYLNQPYDEAKMIFKPEWLRTYHTFSPDDHPEDMRKCLIVDPAISKKKDADWSVVGVAGAIDRKLYVLDYARGRWNPSQLIASMFDMALRWRITDIHAESVAWQAALVHFFNLKAAELDIWLNAKPLPTRNIDKDTRIRGLQPFAEHGALVLAPWMDVLTRELLDFPFGAHDDVADTFAYAPRVLGIDWSPMTEPKKPRRKVETVGDVIDELYKKRYWAYGFDMRQYMDMLEGEAMLFSFRN